MNAGKTVFAQLMDFLPMYEFHRCVERYQGEYKVKSFSCWDQYLSMAFAQLTYRGSLRDIEACLRAAGAKLYHMGIRGKVSRNTLAHANQVRDWRIYQDFAQILIVKARKLYVHDSFGIELNHTIYALDATTIDLCLSLFPWAEFKKRKGAVKLHTLLDLRGQHPCCHRDYSRKGPRGAYPRSDHHRAGRVLCDGPGLFRFCTGSTNGEHSLSSGQKAIFVSNDSIPRRQTNRPECSATRSSCSRTSM